MNERLIDSNVFARETVKPTPVTPYLIDWVVAEADKKGFNGSILKATIDSMPRLSNVFVDEYSQVYLINSALRRILQRSNVNTMDVRMMVVDTEEVEQWKDLISLKVLPFMAEHCQ